MYRLSPAHEKAFPSHIPPPHMAVPVPPGLDGGGGNVWPPGFAYSVCVRTSLSPCKWHSAARLDETALLALHGEEEEGIRFEGTGGQAPQRCPGLAPRGLAFDWGVAVRVAKFP